MTNRKPALFRPKGTKAPKFNGRAKVDAMYDSVRWIKHRASFLAENPRCYACGEASSVVDHLTPHKGDVALFWKEDNMIPLCDVCHNTATALFDRKFVVGSSIKPKLSWLAWRRAKHELSFRVRVVPVPPP